MFEDIPILSISVFMYISKSTYICEGAYFPRNETKILRKVEHSWLVEFIKRAAKYTTKPKKRTHTLLLHSYLPLTMNCQLRYFSTVQQKKPMETCFRYDVKNRNGRHLLDISDWLVETKAFSRFGHKARFFALSCFYIHLFRTYLSCKFLHNLFADFPILYLIIILKQTKETKSSKTMHDQK